MPSKLGPEEPGIQEAAGIGTEGQATAGLRAAGGSSALASPSPPLSMLGHTLPSPTEAGPPGCTCVTEPTQCSCSLVEGHGHKPTSKVLRLGEQPAWTAAWPVEVTRDCGLLTALGRRYSKGRRGAGGVQARSAPAHRMLNQPS